MRSDHVFCCFVGCLLLLTIVPSRSVAFQFGAIDNRTVQFNEEAFDKLHFNQLTMIAARKRCEDLLDAWISLVENAALLSKAQKDKLELAGQIDIHRFFADYETARRAVNFGNIPRDQWQGQLAQLEDRLQPFKTRFAAGLHRESSLFFKTLSTTLDSKQNENVRQLFRERDQFIHANHIRITLQLLERKVPLTRDQRTKIIKLLMSQPDRPASRGTPATSFLQVMNQMAQVGPELREIFSDTQWAVIGKSIEAGKGVE